MTPIERSDAERLIIQKAPDFVKRIVTERNNSLQSAPLQGQPIQQTQIPPTQLQQTVNGQDQQHGQQRANSNHTQSTLITSSNQPQQTKRANFGKPTIPPKIVAPKPYYSRCLRHAISHCHQIKLLSIHRKRVWILTKN